MNIDEIKAYAAKNAQNFIFSQEQPEIKDNKREELLAQKAFLEKELKRMRKRRYTGMDDDRAEDIVEELYRELLEVEKELGSI